MVQLQYPVTWLVDIVQLLPHHATFKVTAYIPKLSLSTMVSMELRYGT